ncbi:TldD/PmbA family protein [Pyxidicoccus fallax]|uniref:TldD/PmbA family protein n=1 Tax=Pyxidicoccus fallax TaxID=394095 RepID=A0A848LHC1_9BACT|nr:metallopeptidase TldD-related protein [Pyxidicoccus fallax]NMO15788.1 TldD/PmbA family protein [Pyxidicoccus fallax]NPC77326.1 TldD/PmbA family protein [Pyxidicoccus fallax]
MSEVRDSEAGEKPSGVDPSAPHELAGAARVALEEFGRVQPSAIAELFLSARLRLTLEYEVSAGTFALSHGLEISAAARVWEGEQHGFAAGPVGSAREVRAVLESATRRLGTGARVPIPPAPVSAGPLPPWPPEPSMERARQQAEHIARTVVPHGVVVQALVLTRRTVWSALLRGGGAEGAHVESTEEAFLRCETSRGAVVDAVALPPDDDEASLVPLRERLTEAVSALEGPTEPADPALPLVLRPAVAAPLVAGLSWLLRGDVASATPALARAVGRKPFPSVLSVEDDPLHPLGTRRREVDDEGRPARGARLVDEGRLMGFLHSGETAARLGAEPNGRGLREGTSPPSPAAINLFIVPRGDALPANYTELTTRVETFTTMPRPGTVSLIAGGWEVRDGQRVRRIAPMELDLPLLETFRALRGVGADLTFFPTADGCGTPTLVLPPPRGG